MLGPGLRILLLHGALVLALTAAIHPSLASAQAPQAHQAPQPGMRHVGPGLYRPFYPANAKQTVVPMRGFWLDALPVTNRQYLAFVTGQAPWRRDRVTRLFADVGYLQHWAGPSTLGAAAHPEHPVTWVSWFAARAYCKDRGARLPTADEWEFAAAASDRSQDGREEPAWRARILAWYSKPAASALTHVGQTPANFWGIQDLHGVIWEWVADFQGTLVAGDSRESGDKERMRFCGSGALSARDATDYASFMRIALRSSLGGHYTTGSLGFRCAHNDQGVPP